MSDSDENLSQLEAYFLRFTDNDSPEANPPNWPMPLQTKPDTLPAPSPFEDYQQYPFHWTGESLKEPPVELQTSVPPLTTFTDKSALIAQFPTLQTSQIEEPSPAIKTEESIKPLARKKRFRHLRRAMSLTHRHKPTPPDTAPPTPNVQYQTPSSGGLKSLESLAHWQLPDPTSAPTPLDSNLIVWPSSLSPQRLSPRISYRAPLGQLSPPSSIPSESDILPPEPLIGLGIRRPSISLFPQPSSSVAQPSRNKYQASLYDTLNLSDPEVLERNANGKVIAGTVEGLVAYITSPDCLDYEVLSDFFVMYRKFLDPSELLGLLCARYEWGLLRGKIVRAPDNEGMVRVRTFAALRHWLLNYFADDFAPSPSLRSQFVKAINSFAKDPKVRRSLRDTRIITELKRCWRRVCTIYWTVEGRTSAVGALDSEISLGGQKPNSPNEEMDLTTRNRVPSLIFRATKKREERLLGSGTSRSSPDLRRRFVDHGKTVAVNTTRPSDAYRRTRIRSTSSLDDPRDSQVKHRRNLSEETKVIYSKNSSPALFQSFARGDGRNEWPPVIVRADFLVTPPKESTATPSWYRKKRKLFRSKRRNLDGEGAVSTVKSSASLNLSCIGQLTDDEDDRSRRTRKSVPSMSVSEPARDRVDFLAAGMWASFVGAASMESGVSIHSAEEFGEALMQGYLHPTNFGDTGTLPLRGPLDKGKGLDVEIDPAVFDVSLGASSASQAFQTTLSMSEIERRLAPSRPPSMSFHQNTDIHPHLRPDIRYQDERYSITPTPPPMTDPPAPPDSRGPILRRRPGGDLRNFETVEQLHPRRATPASLTSSMSDYSFAVVERTSNLGVPSISTESRSLRSLLDIPRGTRKSYSPAHRTSGMALDFSQFRMPHDIESSNDENDEPLDAVEKTLLKLEGKYIRKKPRQRRSSESASQSAIDHDDHLFESALNSDDLRRNQEPSIQSESPPESIMIEREEERWGKRHKHVVDGQECGTPTRHGPFAASSLFDFVGSPNDAANASNMHDNSEEVQELYVPHLTVESAIAELERNQLESQHPRIPAMAPPKPPEDYHRSLASHLPFILQYDSAVLARQFTLIEKDILAEIDWAELVEPTWMNRSPELVDVRDWKGFIVRDEGDGGLHTVAAHFNLMAGWTTSEIVLTQSLSERTMVVSKFIHLAVACRRLHNFATLTQIVVGLQSQYVSSLKKTWEGLKDEDRKLWSELQELVDPRMNWSKMRNEMDRSNVGPRPRGEGCIPFLGIFMSDLVHIASRSLPANKIDFEGLRLRASVIKKVLRMIELAEEYDFQPEPGVGERCLWLTAFDESMLRRIAASLV